MRQYFSAVFLFAGLTFITGILYPLVITLIGQKIFPYQANGSLIIHEQQVVGSDLIGQPFTKDHYFWGRPSATGSLPYDASASCGSNLSPSNPQLTTLINERRSALSTTNETVPIDLLTSSASGLDPHISPAAAYFQIKRIAATRHIESQQLEKLVASHTEKRFLGIFGEPRVNLLRINMALDQIVERQ